MPGKLCIGAVTKSGHGNLQNSKAFCEGMMHRASGYGDAVPITDNPHVSGSEADTAWDLGWTAADDNAESAVPAAELGCCASVGVVPAAVTP